MNTRRPTGWTKDAGFQIGVRKTLHVSHQRLWSFFFSDEGIAIWFGKLNHALPLQQAFRSEEGYEGVITTFKEGSHLRMKWKKPGWERFSMLQVRIMPQEGRTVLSFHQDQLPGETQRTEMRAYWQKVIARIEQGLNLDR